MADEADSKSVVGNHVRVQVPLPAVKRKVPNLILFPENGSELIFIHDNRILAERSISILKRCKVLNLKLHSLINSIDPTP